VECPPNPPSLHSSPTSPPSAATRGETAHWLLVIDELQDQDPHHLEAVFEPMRAANNATAVYIGTVRTTSDALWQKKQELELLQDKDGCQRVWIVPPETVIAQNPAYGRFLAGKIAKLGRDHPIVASEYHNTPLQADGGLFDRRRLQLMRGIHSRQSAPDPAATYLATLDVAGIDEAATDPVAQLANPGRDYTVAHIFEALPDPDGGPPAYLARDIFVDHGTRHFQDAPGRPSLASSLLAWLQHWHVAHLVGDNTGIGAGLVSWLSARFPADHVTGYAFTRQSKAKLGSAFIAVVETGRFRYWTDDDRPLSDAWWFFRQAEACTYHLPPGGIFDRDLQWGVPASAKISVPYGGPGDAKASPQAKATALAVHDDRLLSAALVAVYDAQAIFASAAPTAPLSPPPTPSTIYHSNVGAGLVPALGSSCVKYPICEDKRL